jgi:hypothetical protein
MNEGAPAVAAASSAACRSCGATLVGPCCHASGQGSAAARRGLWEGLSGQMVRRIYGESRWRVVLTSTAAIAVRAIGNNLLLFAALGIALATV